MKTKKVATKNVYLENVTHNRLVEIVNARSEDTGLHVTMKSVIAELVLIAHKKEVR